MEKRNHKYLRNCCQFLQTNLMTETAVFSSQEKVKGQRRMYVHVCVLGPNHEVCFKYYIFRVDENKNDPRITVFHCIRIFEYSSNVGSLEYRREVTML